ncbi:RNA recognition motif domain-containing protein [Aspergillus alliaceus]|uniref:RNA recognition motif domain-containing protein n=1 Tax=Petromyces alliaceus TaxID=209559 RepID=UPI0012A5E6D2|nr:RNA-binding domain-containing protein [Aspergillus alliaceus]KAB8229367.1 RNA-binding domain-containing protein [Aspergillus alliaceus]
MATEYDHENGRYDDEPRFSRDRSASPRDEPRADRARSRSPNGRADDRAPIEPRKPLDDEEGAVNTGSNLFVTGIHPRLTESDISRLFEKYGDVENCSIMVDPHTKESRGFGFVKMVTAEQADAAKEGLQGEVIEGRTLSIEKARRSRPRTPTPGKYFGPPKRGQYPHIGSDILSHSFFFSFLFSLSFFKSTHNVGRLPGPWPRTW